MKHVYVIEGNFCEDTWIEKVFDSLEKAVDYLNTKCSEAELGSTPFQTAWHDELDWFYIRKKELE